MRASSCHFLNLGLAVLSGLTGTVAAEVAGGSGGAVSYAQSIKPLLRQRCVACHGALKQKAGLRLDTAAALRQGGESGPAARPGDPSGSLVLQRIAAADPEERMPPPHEGEPFSAAQQQLLQEWIAAGMPAPADEAPEADPRQHWSFGAVVRPALPLVGQVGAGHPIDAFLQAYQEKQGLIPQGEAPRELLLRRLYLDLVGLPPSWEEIAAAEALAAEAWYEATVDRLLADPRHGERWGRHWMDVWRYSDWWGLGEQLRNSQKHLWHWRDWIVESLNADTPYDEMVRLMLAADESHPGDLGKLRATGFLARNFFLFNRGPWMEETVEHVGKGFLGLTFNCAKCHDHKYDPISQVDYYRMRAFFEPYQVRLDVVPGEVDLERDGLARVYDGMPEAPTYLFTRGDESKPDKSKVIAPGVPALLQFREVAVAPVALPPVGWQPERQPWVIEAHVAAARRRVEEAAAALVAAEQGKQAAEASVAARPAAAVRPAAKDLLEERFAAGVVPPWKPQGGEWRAAPGRLEQVRAEAAWAGLALLEDAPRDFQATLRFTLLGGGKYRSVGFSFDGSLEEPEAEGALFAYASGSLEGPKLQVARRDGAAWQYPAEALRPCWVEPNCDHLLELSVRDTLIQLSLDGGPPLAWRSPQARRRGLLQLGVFDAAVAFHEVRVAPLPEEVVLREPSQSEEGPSPAVALLVAQKEQALAAAALVQAQAELASVEGRGAAMAAGWDRPEAEAALRVAAVQAERQVALAKAERALADADHRLAKPAKGDLAALAREWQGARDAVDLARRAAQDPVAPEATYPALYGAKGTPTRFLSSAGDDPALPFPAHSTGRRQALAEWITDRRNPLTARVAVNHLWLRHFGAALVPNAFDFGRKGPGPVHPELMDWLAAELMEHGWSMKHLHRLIVTSAAYRRSSSLAGGEASAARDPDNSGYWRRPTSRLEAPALRDALLSLAGELDLKMGGPPVLPAAQEESKRRSLYFFHSNNERNLFLTTFDEAAVKECYQRDQSIVPQQALALSNSRLVQQASRQIAQRLGTSLAAGIGQTAEGEAEFIRRAWRLLLGIVVGPEEMAACGQALADWRGQETPDKAEAAARANLVWALLNHNDFVTLR